MTVYCMILGLKTIDAFGEVTVDVTYEMHAGGSEDVSDLGDDLLESIDSSIEGDSGQIRF